jgi:hypothetical protein
MKKNIFIMLSFFILLTRISAMEIETKDNNDQPCWFLALPGDITNLIAHLLEIESEQEFIKRTKAIRLVALPIRYLKHLNQTVTKFKIETQYDNSSTLNLITVCCPENKTTAILIENEFSKIKPTLIVIDKKNNQKLYEKEFK